MYFLHCLYTSLIQRYRNARYKRDASANRSRTPHAARRTPHAARRTPHAARRTPHAARRTPHAAPVHMES